MSVPRFRHVLALSLLGAIVLPVLGLAADRPTGLDLVVLIDQSGSMWGHPDYRPGPNDPGEHRIDAARATIHRLLAETDRSAKIHRLSIIDFGDEAAVVWSAHELRYDPSDPSAMARATEPLIAQRIVGRDWVNTNTPDAMALASKELDAMAAMAPKDGRQRIVLLLTDGRANLPGVDYRELRRRVRREGRRLNDRDAELWVIGLNAADDYWLAGDGAFWKEVAGDPRRARLADHAWPHLAQVLNSMVDEWLDIRSAPIQSEFECPPYLRRLELRAVMSGSGSGANLRILAPDGGEVPRTAGGKTYARFGLDDPPVGVYSLKGSLNGVRVSAEMRPPHVERLRPAGGADLGEESRVVLQAQRASGEPLEPLADWPIAAQVIVESANGAVSELAASYEGEGKWATRWKPELPGLHRVRLQGRVTLADGREIDIFEDAMEPADQVVEVGNQRPYFLKLIRPKVRGVRLAPWRRSTEVRLALVDGDGERIDLAGAVRDPGSWLQVEALDGSGVPVGGAIALQLEDGRFVASLPVSPDWAGNDGLLKLGEVHLRVRAADGHLAEDRVLRAIELSDRNEELRVKGDPLTVGPIELRLPYWLLLGGALPILLILAAAVWLFGRRTLPNYLIGKRDAARGKKVELKVYDMLKDPSGAGAKKIPVTGSSFFKLDGLVNPTVGGQTKLAEHFRLTRLNVPGRPRGRIEYRWQGETKTYNKYLTAGSPQTLTANLVGPGRLVAELVES